MTKIAVPPVEFSDWQKWDAAKSVSAGAPARGGVYLLAHSHTDVAPANAILDASARARR
jgi:hypothetical protein